MAKFSYDEKEMNKFPQWIATKQDEIHSRHIRGLGMGCYGAKDKTKYYPIYGIDMLHGEIVEDFSDYIVGDNFFDLKPYKEWLEEKSVKI